MPPTLERRLVAAAAPAVGAERAAVVRAGAPEREDRLAVELAAVTGFLAEPAVGTAGFLSVVDLPGLVTRVLARLAVVAEMAGFFSSSLALTLARLRCVAVVDEDVGRRVALAAGVTDEGGRVGGLLRPAAVVVLAVEVVEVLVVGRREADVAVAPVALDVAVVPGARGDAVLGAVALLDMVGVWLDATR